MGTGRDAIVVLGEVVGSYGVRGWIRVRPFTVSPETLLCHPAWWLKPRGGDWREYRQSEGRLHSGALLIALELKAAAPCARKPLFPRARDEGDGRALLYLKALLPTKGCVKRRAKVDCYDCLGNRADLKKAVEGIEARLNKR